MKKIFLNSTLMFLLFQNFNCAQASLFWNIDYGIKEFKNSNYTSAKNYLNNYILSNPNDKDGYFWLGKTYFSLNEKQQAKECFKKAYELTLKEKNIEKIDFNIEFDANIEDYFDMAAMFFEAGNYKEANLYADMMLTINPKSSSAYFVKSKISQVQGDEKKAIEYLNSALILNNKLLDTNLAKSLKVLKVPELSSEMYYTFAFESYFKGDIKTAIKNIKKYLASQPQDKEALLFLAELHIKNFEIIDAQNTLEEIFKLDLNNIQANLLQAEIYHQTNDERYEAMLLKTFKINPNNQEALLHLGNYYLSMNDFEESKKYFESLINVNDAFFEGYFGYIYSLIQLGKTNEAMASIRKITALNKDSSEIAFLLCEICQKNGEYEEALEYILEAIKKQSHPNYYLKKAEINYILKNYENSINDLISAKKMHFSSSEVDELLVKNYLKQQDYRSARIMLDGKNSLDKNSLMYKYNLYVIQKLQGYGNTPDSQFAQIKKTKPATIEDYIDLAEINYENFGLTSAIKILDNGIKKNPKEAKLYFEKIKYYYLQNENKKINSVIEIMQNL